jgi:hypothetical protein
VEADAIGESPLALFTHAPVAEFIYLLSGVKLQLNGQGMFSLPGGDIGWPRWQLLTQKKVLRAVNKARGREEEMIRRSWLVTRSVEEEP